MDDKGSPRRKSDASRRRRTRVKIDKRMVWKFLSTHKNTLITSLLLLLITCLLFGVFSQFQAPVTSSVPGGVTEVTYSAFMQQVKAGNVQAVAIQGEGINSLLIHPLITTSNATGSGQTGDQATTPANIPTSVADADYLSWLHYVGASNNSSLSGPTIPPVVNAGRAIYTHALPSGDAALLPLLRSMHVIVDTLAPASPSPWLSLFLRFTPVLLLVVLLLVFLYARRNGNTSRSMDDRVTQIGKSRARRFVRTGEGNTSPNETRTTRHPGVGRPTSPTTPARTQGARSTTIRVSTEPQVTFADVAGIDEVRVDLEEIVQFLRQPERFDKLGAHIPRGALLVGPPGTGKTLLAKAVAGEAHVPFFSMSASEFVEMFVGVGASRVRDLFQQARQAAPSVIFIDEIDAVGRKRSARMMGNDERDQTLNQLLVELDGFDARHAVVVMAATNRADILDKALLRPGRFDRHITVSPPDRVGREAILKVHTRNTPLHEEVSLERLARMTTGMTGADLANLVNEAALTAARRDMEHLTHDCFEDALARVQLGALRPLVMSERERRIIAYHEGGHALVAHHLPEADRVNRVTILPRGQSLGVTQFTAEEDRYNYSRETLMARIAVGLGGRVAEELTFGHKHITTGAENDFQVVTSLARRMVTRWGMSEQFGVVFADGASEGDYSLNMRRSDPADLPSPSRALLLDADGQPILDDDPLPARTHQFAMTAPRNSNGVMLNALIDTEVQRILQEGQAIARTLLLKHSQQLTLLADTLMEREQLDRAQFEALLREE